MKKIIGIGLVLIILIVGVSFFINNPIGNNDGDDLSQQSVDYSENGISLSMPGNWVSAKSNSNETVLAVADPDAKDSAGFNSINVNIEKKSNARSLILILIFYTWVMFHSMVQLLWKRITLL